MERIGKIAWGLKFIIAGVGATLVTLYFVPSMGLVKIWSFLVTILLPFVPDILRKMGLKLSSGLDLYYQLFLIAAMVLGIDLDWYKLWHPFDKIVHAASGVLTGLVAVEILEKSKIKLSRLRALTLALFILGFVALVAVGWECFEFGYDQLCGGKMQQLIKPGVEDTMWDLIMALMGGSLVTVYALNSKKLKN